MTNPRRVFYRVWRRLTTFEMQSSLVLVLLGQWSFAFHRLCSPSLPAASTNPTKLFPINPNSVLAAAWATGSSHCSSSVPTCSYLRWATWSNIKFYLTSTESQITDSLGFYNLTEQFCLAPQPPHAAFLPLKNQPTWKTSSCVHEDWSAIAWTATKPRVKPAKQQPSSRSWSLPLCFWLLVPFPSGTGSTNTKAGFFWDRGSKRSS